MTQCSNCNLTSAHFPSPQAMARYTHWLRGVWLCPGCAMRLGYCIGCLRWRGEQLDRGELGMCYRCEREAWASIEGGDEE